jgi:hypothetical protein
VSIDYHCYRLPLKLGLVLTKLPMITADVLLSIPRVGVNVSLLFEFSVQSAAWSYETQ